VNPTDFGRLVASLRKEHENADGSLWTQEKLAQEANTAAGTPLFSRDIICSIELGKRNLEGRMLVPLATALQLTSHERKEFFLAASGVDNSEIACQENDPGELFSQVTESVKELCVPAIVLDAYCNILAVNGVLLALIDFSQAANIHENKYDPFRNPNLLLFIFSEEGAEYLRKLMGEDFSNCAYAAINAFRAFSLAYRSTQYFQDLLHELRKFRLFKRYWSELYLTEKTYGVQNINIDVDSSKMGRLAVFISFQTIFTKNGELHVFVLNPRNRDTADAFARAMEHSQTVIQLASWPNTNLK